MFPAGDMVYGGGLALAAQKAAKGRKKPKPPLAAAIARVTSVSHTVRDAQWAFLIELDLQFLHPATNAPLSTSADAVVGFGTAETMRAEVVRAAQQTVSDRLAGTVPPYRVAVLLV